MPTKGYVFQWGQETAWLVSFAVATFLFTTLADLAPIDDPKTWILSLGVGLGRVIGATVVNQLLKLKGA